MNEFLHRFKSSFKDFKDKLSILDLFGQKIDLTYKKEVYYRSYYGALYTLFMFLIIILQIYAGYKDMTSRMNPIINTMEFESNKVEKLDLINENITIAFAINTLDRKVHISDKVFTYEGKIISRSKNDTLDKTSTFLSSFENCTKKHFKHFRNIYQNFSLYEAHCLSNKQKTNKSMEIFSIPEEFTETYFKLKIRVCENKALTVKDCYLSKEFLNEILPSLNLNIYLIHQYFDGIDVNNPIKPRLSFVNFNVQEELFLKKKNFLYFTKNFLTDYSDFYSAFIEPETKSFVGFSNKDVQNIVKFDNDDYVNFIEIYFRIHNIPRKFTRKYTTYFDLLANIGGLFNALFILGMIIFSFINKILLDVKIINDHFNIYGITDHLIGKQNNLRTKSFPNNELKYSDFFNKNFNFLNSNPNSSSDNPNKNIQEKEKFLDKLKKTTKVAYSINTDEEKFHLLYNNFSSKYSKPKLKKHSNNDIKTDLKELKLNHVSNERVINDFEKINKTNSKLSIFSIKNNEVGTSDINNKMKKEDIINERNINLQKNEVLDMEEDQDFNARESRLSNTYTIRSISFDAKNEDDIKDLPFKKILIQESMTTESKKDKKLKIPFRLKYGMRDILKNAFFITSKVQIKKYEIYELCRKVIENYLDVNELIPLIQGLKITRSILFSNNELEIIDYYKKPIIKVDELKSKLIFRKSDIYYGINQNKLCSNDFNQYTLEDHKNIFIRQFENNKNNESIYRNKKIIELYKLESK